MLICNKAKECKNRSCRCRKPHPQRKHVDWDEDGDSIFCTEWGECDGHDKKVRCVRVKR